MNPDPRLRELLVLITETPAPPFMEEARGELVAGLWRDAGLEVTIDELGNVIAEVPGGEGPLVCVAAHLDTVFPADIPIEVTETPDGRLAAPGIGDNSISVAALTRYAEEIQAGKHTRRPRLVLAATVGEEGIGDIRGARHLVATQPMDVFIAVDGPLDRVVDQAVGSLRFEARFAAEGGHAWSRFGSPSAIHAAGDAVARLLDLDVPTEPRSSFNVGVINGGTSVNAIAEEASFTLDLRSVDTETLVRMHADAQRMTREAAEARGATVTFVPVGDRPAGRNADNRLVDLAMDSLRSLGIDPTTNQSSTDANAALAAGIPAITIGVYIGGDAHRVSEWLDPTSLDLGYRVLTTVLADLTDF